MYDIDTGLGRVLASVTTYLGRLYACFVNSPAGKFNENEAKLRRINDSFRVMKKAVSKDEERIMMQYYR